MWRGPVSWLVGIALMGGCDGQGTLDPTTGGDQGSSTTSQPAEKLPNSNTSTGDDGTNNPPPPPPPPPPPFVPPRIDAYVLKNRQKFVGLPAYIKGLEFDSFTFAVTTPPAHGQLLGTAPNLCYVPAADYTGYDQLTYRADSGASSITQTLYFSVGSDYVAPIGIPTPEFGVTQSHRMYVGATYDYGGTTGPYQDAGNGPYTHYVDFDSGSDAGNPFGTAAQPRKSIPQGLTPGSVVEVHGTNITTPSIHVIRGEGTLNQPIFIRGGSATQKPVLRRNVVVEGDFIICENLEFDCQDSASDVWFWTTSSQVAPFTTFHHVALRHSLFRDQPTVMTGNPCAMAANLIGFDPALDTAALQIENIVAYDLEVRNFSQWDDYSGGQDYVGVLFGPNTRDCWVLDCHLHHLHSTGVSTCRCNGTPNMTPPRHIYAGRNYVHNVKEQMIVFKYGVDCVASQNVCHTVRVSGSSVGAAIPILNNDATADWPGSDGIWVLFNTIYDCERGVYHDLNGSLLPGGVLPNGAQSRSYVIGNTFFDLRAIRGGLNSFGIAVFKGDFAQSRIVNNLVRDCREGFRLGLSGMLTPELCGQVVRSNIVTDLAPLDAGQHSGCEFFVPTDTISPFTTIEKNLYFQSDRALRFSVTIAGGIEMDYSTVAALQASTPYGVGSLESDPQFVNAAGLDFRLSANSPCIGSGVRDDAYDLFATTFPGLSIDFYQNGKPRPSGAFDIGPLPPTP